MSSPERMSPADSAFWHMESEVSRMHNVTVALFAGPAPSFDEVAAHVRRRVPLVPRFRQRVVAVPFDLGRPVWVDDPRFELGAHVADATCETGFAGLAELVSLIVSTPLDRDRPLWHLTRVTGLPDDGWALVSKVHHSLIDGVSGTDLLGVLVDSVDDDRWSADWEPDPVPTGSALARAAMVELLTDRRERYRAFRANARRGRRTLAAVRRPATDRAGIPGGTPLRGPVGSERRWASASAPMSRIARLCAAFEVSTHDVVLAAVTSGLRDLLRARDEGANRVPDVRAVVPMAVGVDERAPGGAVSASVVDLPTGEPSLRARLRELASRDRPGADDEATGTALTRIHGFAAPALASLGLRESTRAGYHERELDVVVVIAPGPDREITAMGRAMTDAYPVVPLAPGVRVGVGVFSYVDRITFGVTTDRASLPDARVVASGIEHALTELDRSAGPRPDPDLEEAAHAHR